MNRPVPSAPVTRSHGLTWALVLLTLLLTIGVLIACGGDDDEDGFACCNGGEYYSCPNKSAALVCDDSLSPQTVCDFNPENNDLCR